jgi:Protein of unknown function (DUF1566)
MNAQRSFITSLVALASLTALALVAAESRAQTVANGPYHATPSWDQTIPLATRFIVLSNMTSEAVLDRETGLVWQKTPSPVAVDYGMAVCVCEFGTTGKRMGWRVPRMLELQSLIQVSAGQAALPVGPPFGIRAGVSYWTSTLFNAGAYRNSFLLVDPANANVAGFAGATYPGGYVWCVRGGQPSDTGITY